MEVKDALEMLDEYQTYWRDIYELAKEDAEFVTASDQWKPAARKYREERGQPCLTINLLPQYTHQVSNQIRQNTPSIKILPGDKIASIPTAKVMKGLIRNIEYRSGADEVYDTASEHSVDRSIGFIRVDHDYISYNSELQELLIKRVQNPLAVWIDPSSVQCDGRDAMGAIAVEEITKAKFEKKYPGKDFASFEVGAVADGRRNTITIGEIFIKEEDREAGTCTIKRYIVSGADILEETIFPGEYIPIVPVYGQESWIGNKRHLLSLIRNAKDPQRRYNHWASVESEILSKAGVAPFVSAVGQTEDFEDAWMKPGSEDMLRYKQFDIDGNPAPRPERMMPAPVPVAIINAMQGAKEDIKAAMGLYDASVGDKSNETSGVAIDARKEQGNVATFHFADNLNRSIQQVGRILVSAIPMIYDSARILQIIDDEDEPQLVGVNGEQMQKGQEEPHNLTQGKYDVRVSTGPSYTSKRQEASAFMSEVIKANPELIGVAGDLIFKNMDIVGADALSARLRKTIPKELTAEEDAKKDGQQPPDPEKMQMQQVIEQLQGQIQQMMPEIEGKQAEMQMKGMEVQGNQAAKQAEIQLKQQEMQMKYELESRKLENEGIKLQMEAEKLQLEREKMMIAAQPQPEQQKAQPTGIKLDTTGFQFMKTPEQEAMEASAAEESAMKEMEERARKDEELAIAHQERMAVIQALMSIAQGVETLNQKVGQPMQVVRDPNTGMITGGAPVTIN